MRPMLYQAPSPITQPASASAATAAIGYSPCAANAPAAISVGRTGTGAPRRSASVLPNTRRRPYSFSNPSKSDLPAFLLEDLLHRRALQHAVLESGVVLHARDRQLAANAPGVEDQRVRIEHRVLFAEPLAPGVHLVDLLEV